MPVIPTLRKLRQEDCEFEPGIHNGNLRIKKEKEKQERNKKS
jgi:hypothetical protein